MNVSCLRLKKALTQFLWASQRGACHRQLHEHFVPAGLIRAAFGDDAQLVDDVQDALKADACTREFQKSSAFNKLSK